MEPSDMALSNEVVKQVRESHDLTLKQVAFHTGYSTSHINAIELGDRVPNPEYLAGLFKITRDWRVIQVVAPALMPCELLGQAVASTPAENPQRTPPAGDPRDLVPKVIDAIKQTSASAEYCHRIVRDGRVDDSDDTAITQFREHMNRAIGVLSQCSQAIAAWRESDVPK